MRRAKYRRGALSIQTAVFFMVVAAAVSLIISVFAVYSKASAQNAAAHDIVRFIELRGAADDTVYKEFARLKTASGLDCTMTVSANNAAKIQFGDEFTVTLISKAKIGLGGVISAPVTLRSVAMGRSEKYWK